MTASKTARSLAVGFACSGVFLFFAARHIHPAAFLETFSKIKVLWIVPFIAAMCLDLFLRAWRWKLLLPRDSTVKIFPLSRLLTIGLALNNVLPLRLGELGRGYLASRELKVPVLTALSTILIERVLDSIFILGLFCAASFWWPASAWLIHARRTAGLLAAALAVFLAAACGSQALLKKETPLRAWIGRHPRLGKLAEECAVGAAALKRFSTAAPIFALSAAAWLNVAGMYFWAAKAMALEAWISYPRSIVLLAVAGASTLLPAVPGYFGTMEFAVSRVLVHLELSADLSLAYAGFQHMTNYLFITFLGLLFLYQTGSSLGGLWKKLEEQR
ncbi:MAG: hypothetical protein A3G41_05290 [Elusimicrobia bacterium RIFCSPLOWO2_12_FULL_59_9]|nr:MAG: hypothetical protein A3G41_05290 [Elusimicrobia bacterium RIFCSPLOWO2_12_FULL_59_9]